MTTKAAFNAEEWPVIVNAPYLTAMVVIAASRGGRMRETLAIAEAYASARQHYTGELLQQILTTSPSFDPTTPAHSGDELHDEALTTLRRAVSLLARSATETEVNTYKRFVYYLAETVARAHREGSFLGIGGQEISEAEQALLDEIAALFDEPAGGVGDAPPPGGASAS
jgi:hypothetical protein